MSSFAEDLVEHLKTKEGRDFVREALKDAERKGITAPTMIPKNPPISFKRERIEKNGISSVSTNPRPVVVYRGDIPVINRIRPGFVEDEVCCGRIVIVDNPERKVT